jgi:hypothetical protein
MEHTTAFDLNTALGDWMGRLKQSPGFRQTDVVELESHIRDSVTQLQTQGLSAEESFMVATKRVGTAEKLETEFAKVHRSPKLILINLLILAFFSVGCWFLWGLLKIATLTAHHGQPLPGFTVLMVGLRSRLVIPPVVAAAYCLWVTIRNNHSRSSWIGFFAWTAGTLILLSLPTMVAVVLPLFDGLNQISARSAP